MASTSQRARARTHRTPFVRAFAALTAAAVAMLGLWAAPSATAVGTWWNNQWTHRVTVTVNANGFARTDKVVDASINYSALLGGGAAFDPESVRVLEIVGGNFSGQPVPAQYDSASGETTWLMPGATGANATRTFDVYFARTTANIGAQVVTPRVSVSSAFDAGQDSFKVDTPRGSWYLQKQGGSFSSLIDNSGANWISYNSDTGAAGEFRGIPNFPFPEGYFHPGFVNANSQLVSSGPLKAVIRSASNDGKFAYVNEIYPDYVTSRVTQTDGTSYWWLYEGTPGGIEDIGQFSSLVVGRSSGETNSLADVWSGDLETEEWVYFGVPGMAGTGRSLYLAHHENDGHVDSYWPLSNPDGAMTVFGFGRNGPSSTDYMTGTNTFTMGLFDSTTHGSVAAQVRNAYKPVLVNVGSVETGGGGGGGTTPTTPTTTPAPQPGQASGYVALPSPVRLLDTRPTASPVEANAPRAVQVVANRNPSNLSVPAGATAAVLNVTAIGANSHSHLTVWPNGQDRPTVSNINYLFDTTVPNLVTVAIGTNGQVQLAPGFGGTHVVVDLFGYYQPGAGGGFHPMTPTRLVDTRLTGGALGPNTTRALSVSAELAQDAGIDLANLQALALNVTAVDATSVGHVTVAPTISGTPSTSNLNVTPTTAAVANGVITRVTGGNGGFTLYNANGSTHVVVDIVGWYDDGNSNVGSGLAFRAIVPERLRDTRLPGGSSPVAANGTESVQIAGANNSEVPGWAGAVAVNLTSVTPGAGGYLTMYPAGQTKPDASTLNVMPGVTRANATLARTGTGGGAAVFTQPQTHLVVDAFGWFG